MDTDEDPRAVRKVKPFCTGIREGEVFRIQCTWHRQLRAPVATTTCEEELFLYVLMRLHLDDAVVAFSLHFFFTVPH